MPLTDVAIRNSKPKDRLYKISDGGGLQLHVTPNGSRLWRLAYRFAGKQRELSIGVYPTVTLGDARIARDAAKRQIATGVDPSQQKQVEKAQRRIAAESTFKIVAEEYRSKLVREGKAEQTMDKYRWILEDLMYPFIGDRPIGEISAPELLKVLRRIEGRGHFETSARGRRIAGQIFRYAIATGRADRDVAADLRGALTSPRNKQRAAITDPDGIGELLRAIDTFKGQGVTLFALRLAPLLFLRPGELRLGLWPEIDLKEKLWRVPPERMKMRREHLVPLSRQAIEILQELRHLTGHGNYMFPSAWGSRRPISENTINGALRRLGYGKEEMCAHGFRRMASTRLHESGFKSEWVERQLAHADANAMRGIYNSAEYLNDRRAMMQWWADKLDALRAVKSTP